VIFTAGTVTARCRFQKKMWELEILQLLVNLPASKKSDRAPAYFRDFNATCEINRFDSQTSCVNVKGMQLFAELGDGVYWFI